MNLGNIAAEVCTDDQYHGACVLQHEAIKASVVCCRDDESNGHRGHWWSNSYQSELQCAYEHVTSDGMSINVGWYFNRRGRKRGDNSRHDNDNECFPTDVSYTEAEDFCASLDAGTVRDVLHRYLKMHPCMIVNVY